MWSLESIGSEFLSSWSASKHQVDKVILSFLAISWIGLSGVALLPYEGKNRIFLYQHQWSLIAASILVGSMMYLYNHYRRVDVIECDDGIEGSLQRMEMLAGDGEAQRMGLKVLTTLLTTKTPLEKSTLFRKFMAARGPTILLRTGRQHFTKLDIVEKTFEILNIIARNKEIQKDFLLDKTFSVPMMHELVSHRRILKDAKIIRHFLLLAGTLSQDNLTVKDCLVEHQMAALIHKCMKSHPESPDIQQWACWCLFNMSHDHGDMKAAILTERNLLITILKAMQKFSTHQRLQQMSCLVLSNCLVQVPSTLQASGLGLAIAEGMLPIVHHAKKEFPADERINDLGNLLLGLAHSHQSATRFEELE